MNWTPFSSGGVLNRFTNKWCGRCRLDICAVVSAIRDTVYNTHPTLTVLRYHMLVLNFTSTI